MFCSHTDVLAPSFRFCLLQKNETKRNTQCCQGGVCATRQGNGVQMNQSATSHLWRLRLTTVLDGVQCVCLRDQHDTTGWPLLAGDSLLPRITHPTRVVMSSGSTSTRQWWTSPCLLPHLRASCRSNALGIGLEQQGPRHPACLLVGHSPTAMI